MYLHILSLHKEKNIGIMILINQELTFASETKQCKFFDDMFARLIKLSAWRLCGFSANSNNYRKRENVELVEAVLLDRESW